MGYGFTSSSKLQYDKIISQFSSYGTLLYRFPQTPTHSLSKANWVLLEYKTRLEAEKALCQNGLLIDTRMMDSDREEVMVLGVMRVDMVIAPKLGLGLTNLKMNDEVSHSRSDIEEDKVVLLNNTNNYYLDRGESPLSYRFKGLKNEEDILL